MTDFSSETARKKVSRSCLQVIVILVLRVNCLGPILVVPFDPVNSLFPRLVVIIDASEMVKVEFE